MKRAVSWAAPLRSAGYGLGLAGELLAEPLILRFYEKAQRGQRIGTHAHMRADQTALSNMA